MHFVKTTVFFVKLQIWLTGECSNQCLQGAWHHGR